MFRLSDKSPEKSEMNQCRPMDQVDSTTLCVINATTTTTSAKPIFGFVNEKKKFVKSWKTVIYEKTWK